jgi:glycosyltransferase involved in cell wall biosynthesis
VVTKNAEKHIKNAIQSALFADEILVLDSGSTDETCDIAEKLGAIAEYQEWLGFGRQKNKAVELASNDWVFVLDADEQITEQLKDEIIETLKNPISDGFQIARLNNFFGRFRNGNIYFFGLMG